ncbi:hypothetical protein OHW09_09850 [Acinetobacter baumannii]|nr:hypothetical protein [Acinetobacter baumannii]MDC4947207.1 hypothetical protein [Acinetobacter baumannii]
MKPEQFIREYGVEKAREVVDGAPEGTTHIHSVTWQNYKQGDSNNYVWGRSDQEGWYLSIYDTLNGMMVLEDLKRLVESVELVEKFGSLIAAKAYVPDGYKSDRLKQAIRDHESIYGGGQ